MAVPVAIMDASIHTRSPRLCEREVSATQDGIVEVFMPAMIFSQKKPVHTFTKQAHHFRRR